MNLARQYRQLAGQITTRLDLPAVSELILPRYIPEPEKLDEFGFVVLEDGSAAPFYARLDDALFRLWQQWDRGDLLPAAPDLLLDYLVDESPHMRALGLGVFNAVSQHLFTRAGFDPTQNQTGRPRSKPAPVLIGMVGYFRPLIDRLLTQGNRIIVLELNPARVELQAGVELAAGPEVLLQCDHILCTASTLINNSLHDILRHKTSTAQFSLIGPTGSGLPDLLFASGVDDVGGFRVSDPVELRRLLQADEPWGGAGSKYVIERVHYPGYQELLDRALA